MPSRRRSIRTPEKRSAMAPSRRPQPDAGPTDFALLRKAELIGETIVCDVSTRTVRMTGRNNGQAAFSALSRLHWRDRITLPQFRAGLQYAHLRAVLWGRAHPKPASFYRLIHEHISSDMHLPDEELAEEREERMDAMRLAYRRGDDHLRRMPHSTGVRVALRATCVDDLYPANDGWMARLRHGLHALADVWETDQW
ncbi:hypothetical protein [Aestuariivirga sp.]|uniref:hypothetical protein n=1 Tax=Aestuariivirga sp. TaxID=2650926 RepID=UPI0039E43936